MQGLLGRKVGMTQVFGDEGEQIPVTVLEVGPCVVLQRREGGAGGPTVQIGFVDVKESRATRPAIGHAKKAGTAPKRHVKEFVTDADEGLTPGDVLTAAMFESAAYVDIQGVTKGRGFQGVVRRFRMGGGPATHGGHSKRRVGSIGCRTDPGQVHKNKRLPGHMGVRVRTQQNLRVVAVRPEDNLLLVRGAVPGPNGGIVIVKRSLKKAAKTA